jgi:hypothetical protein
MGIGILVLPASLWYVAKLLWFGTAGDVGVHHWRFFGFHAEGLAPYLWQVLSAWGWAGALAALAGVVLLMRRARERPLELVPLAALAAVLVFWGLLYGYRAPRFAATALPLLVLPTALGLAVLPRPLRAVAALLVVAASVWPLPGFRADGARVALAPAPFALEAGASWATDGSTTPQLGDLRLIPTAPRIADLAWVAARRPIVPASTLEPGAFDGVAGVLLVDTSPERRYDRTRHLSALVRAPTVRAPRSAVAALGIVPRPLGRRGPFSFSRFTSPVDGHDIVLAVPADESLPASRPGHAAAPELARAKAIAAHAAGRHVIAVVEPGASWWAWLVFLVPGELLHYVEPEGLPGLDAFLATATRPGPTETVAGLAVEPVEGLGRVGIVVRGDM